MEIRCNDMELTETQKKLLHTQCTVCEESELSEMDSVGDDAPFLWCPNCESTVDSHGTVEHGYVTEFIHNPEVCSSSLNEWNKPITEGETAHKWSPQLSSDDYGRPVYMCDECNATKEPEKNIIITIEGGCLRDVEGLPEGWTYTLNDLDDLEADKNSS